MMEMYVFRDDDDNDPDSAVSTVPTVAGFLMAIVDWHVLLQHVIVKGSRHFDNHNHNHNYPGGTIAMVLQDTCGGTVITTRLNDSDPTPGAAAAAAAAVSLENKHVMYEVELGAKYKYTGTNARIQCPVSTAIENGAAFSTPPTLPLWPLLFCITDTSCVRHHVIYPMHSTH